MACFERELPCGGDPDEPCPCGALAAAQRTPKRRVRYSAHFVGQMRSLGAKRFPLQPVPDETR